MQTVTVTVDPDGRVHIPGTRAGQTITVHFEPEEAPNRSEAVRTPEEQERLIQELLDAGRRFREQADPEWLKLDHDEWLYDENGLPK